MALGLFVYNQTVCDYNSSISEYTAALEGSNYTSSFECIVDYESSYWDDWLFIGCAIILPSFLLLVVIILLIVCCVLKGKRKRAERRARHQRKVNEALKRNEKRTE